MIEQKEDQVSAEGEGVGEVAESAGEDAGGWRGRDIG